MNLFQWLTGGRSVRGLGLSFYKRGLTRATKHDPKGAMADYTAAIDLRDAPDDVRAMALYNRALLHVAARNFPKAIQDLNAVLAMAAPLGKIKSAARQKLDRMQHSHRTIAVGRPSLAMST